jgi:hypothetical protein
MTAETAKKKKKKNIDYQNEKEKNVKLQKQLDLGKCIVNKSVNYLYGAGRRLYRAPALT